MTDIPDNPLAFPESCTSEGYAGNVERGMTLRDYFAAKAMQEMLSEKSKPSYISCDGESEARRISREAYFMADAMLKARML